MSKSDLSMLPKSTRQASKILDEINICQAILNLDDLNVKKTQEIKIPLINGNIYHNEMPLILKSSIDHL